ncbi:MAG: hypothetical protein ACR2IF_12230 [Terriglobales bacterium]
MRIYKLAVVIFLAFPLIAAAQMKLEKTPALTDDSVPAAVRNALEPNGSRVLRGDGMPLCEIWLRRSLPLGKAGGKGVAYPEFPQSVMLGVIRFPNGGKDFRGQTIKPGVYTMRYELLPEDGNHMGVAPNPDFVLLLPAAADSDPNAHYDFARMVKLSSEAAGTAHPAAFSMPSPPTGETPRAFQNADGFEVFAASLKTDSGRNIPFALVVKGQAEQ